MVHRIVKTLSYKVVGRNNIYRIIIPKKKADHNAYYNYIIYTYDVCAWVCVSAAATFCGIKYLVYITHKNDVEIKRSCDMAPGHS